MDIYGHLMKTVNRQAANKLGKAIMGNQKKSGSNLVAEGVRAKGL